MLESIAIDKLSLAQGKSLGGSARVACPMSIRKALRRRGFDVRRVAHMPFGVHWPADLASLMGSRIDIALDVGANVGQTARHLMEQFPMVHVFSVEPNPPRSRNFKP